MQLTAQFVNNIREQNLFQPGDPLLLAVSGGVDSVVLCDLCHKAGFPFTVAHVNFQLRGDESEGDEQFVRCLADKYRVPVTVRKFDTHEYADKNKVSIQVAARDLRYGWFDELLSAGVNARWLLTAHHQDDNIETVMMNFFRGTGISGLRGILPKIGKIVRPLLDFSKETLVQYARENNLEWREDSSNLSEKYSRNYFRNAFIPFVRNIFPEAETNIADNISRFRGIEMLYGESVARHKKKLMETRGREIHIPVLALKKVKPLETIMYEIVKPFNFSPNQLKDILHLLDAEQGKYVGSVTHRIIKNRNWLIIASNDTRESDHIVIEEGETQVRFGKTDGSATASAPNSIEFNFSPREKLELSASAGIAHIDIREIKYPLILRKWKQGDYFYPLGMRKKKKIARFLIDLKLSPTAKENVWVLESGKKICWVAGMRIDDRFKVTDKTKHVLTVTLKS